MKISELSTFVENFDTEFLVLVYAAVSLLVLLSSSVVVMVQRQHMMLRF